jgi:predicted ferric reductase
MRKFLIWTALLAIVAIPIIAAATSPLLAWRDPIYIAAGFAGVIAMALLLFQPLLISGDLPGVSGPVARRAHRWIAGSLVAVVVIHVVGLWITSPPDVIDALLFASPTRFSAWGVVAMWAVFAAAGIAILRRKLPVRPMTWRRLHICLALIVVTTSIMHAMLIEGTMEIVSKIALCVLVFAAVIKALVGLRARAR